MTPQYGIRYPSGLILPVSDDLAETLAYANTCAEQTSIVLCLFGALWARSVLAPTPSPRTEGTAENPYVVLRNGSVWLPETAVAS